MSWKSMVLTQLEQRDLQQLPQQPNDLVLTSYNQIVERLLATEKKLEAFQGTDLQVELRKTLEQIEQLTETNKKLELKNLSISSINTNHEKEIKYLKHKLQKLEDSYRRLNDRVHVKNEENQAKSKALSLINDDILALQLENNLLNEKIKKLELENNELVIRWINKVKEDAEKLNDANAFLENVRLNNSNSSEN